MSVILSSGGLTITPTDRCDRCPAAAQMAVMLRVGAPLMFCGHHARQYEVPLFTRNQVLLYVDNRPEHMKSRMTPTEDHSDARDSVGFDWFPTGRQRSN